ncbi:HD domain-containing protein [Cesiribacter andamanensis]|uniref:Bifunctional (P)ppGpp synthase/hydrolase SpoT n=1 Tax=Cesiribacter andamanensis AMV16 TaxID=1279009 RepID=M7MZI0_9BACT|nr:HD domain-containing protein [Cesiribacter andamanensis]EMR01828.1 Bifunctional (p)ppGpp synthase/hydrolase SpoT [Cesiribacter andamanensis AMV16]
MNSLEQALDFARQAHGSQQRKFTGEPYIEHPKRVAGLVQTVAHTEAMLCAAYLHDVVEDTPVSHQDIEQRFGREVAHLVHELTDEYMKEAYPRLNRKIRKQKEVARQAGISPQAKTIKLADVIDNTRDIIKNDKDFAVKYIPEMEALLEALQGGDFKLLMLACYEVQKAKLELQQWRKSGKGA